MGVVTLVDAKVACIGISSIGGNGYRFGKQDAVAIKDSPTYGGAVSQTTAVHICMGIARDLLRYYHLPVNQSAAYCDEHCDKEYT
jgi:hypothetical protein